MSDWSAIFLGIIAVSTLVMALIQVGAIVATLRVVRETQKMLTTVQQDVRPLIARATGIAEEASKVVSEASRTVTLATAQVQKVDTLVTDLTRRVDETAVIVQKAIVTPAREGIAIFAAIRTALGALKGMGDFRGRTGRSTEEEDPLFIG